MSKSIQPKKKRGGPRKGAGRKPVESRKEKEAVTIYVEKEDIKRHGGKISLKDKLVMISRGPSELDYSLSMADLPKLEAIVKPKEPPKADYSANISRNDNEAILKQINDIERELKNPPTTILIGRKAWEQIRKDKIEELKQQLK